MSPPAPLLWSTCVFSSGSTEPPRLDLSPSPSPLHSWLIESNADLIAFNAAFRAYLVAFALLPPSSWAAFKDSSAAFNAYNAALPLLSPSTSPPLLQLQWHRFDDNGKMSSASLLESDNDFPKTTKPTKIAKIVFISSQLLFFNS